MKTVVIGALLGALALTPLVASAGFKVPPQLVSVTSTKFSGNLADARNSADTVQYIGCQGGSTFSYCSAKTASGSSVMCSSSNAGFMSAVQGLTPNSKIEVGYSTGTCTYIWVWTMSSQATPL